MAKFPSAQDLGPAPRADGSRPIGQIDATPIAQGAMAIAQGAEKLGAGVSKLADGVGDAVYEKQRYEYAEAHGNFLTQSVQQSATLANDQDYATLPQRYDEGAKDIQQSVAAGISNENFRNRFIASTNADIARGKAAMDARAHTLEGSAKTAATETQGDTNINIAVANPMDPSIATKTMASYGSQVDALAAGGFITPVEALQRKQSFAHKFAIADGVARADTDPVGLVNELRAAPGSPEQIDNRVVQVESGGKTDAKNSNSSAYGLGGFIDSTWLGLIKKYKPEYADMSDKDVLALRADGNLSREMVARNREENTKVLTAGGVPATAGNVYLAHFLGPEGAVAVANAPPGTPIYNVLKDAVGDKKALAMISANYKVLNGQTAGGVSQWANDRMGGVGPGGGHLYDVLRPDQRSMLLEHAQAQINKQTTVNTATFHNSMIDDLAEADRTGMVTKPKPVEDFIATYGAEAGQQQFKLYQAGIQLGADKKRLSGMSDPQIDELIKSYDPKPGDGFQEAAQRQDDLRKAATGIVRARAEDPDFKNSVIDDLAQAQRNGKADKPKSIEDFTYHYGAEQGPKMFAQYKADLVAGADAKEMPAWSPEVRDAVLKRYTPTPGADDFTEQAKRRDQLVKVAQAIQKSREDDPAQFAIANLPAVTESFQKFSSVANDPTASPEDRQAAARDYAVKTQIEQTRLGIRPEDQRIVPDAYIQRLNSAITNSADAADPKARLNVIAQVQREAETWGDQWPGVMRQLSDKVSPTVRAIAAGADPTAMTRLLSVGKDEAPGKLLKEQNETKFNDVSKALNEEMAPYMRTLVGRQKDRDFTGYYNMGLQLAALNVRDGQSASDAAANAFKSLIGGRYEFRDTYRIPKSANVSADDVQAGVAAAKSELEQGGGKNLLEQARDQYPILKNQEIGYKENFGRSKGYLESWPAGETGDATLPRPSDLPADKFGLEIYDRKTSPKDVLADVVSHNLVDTDPKIKAIYSDFKASLQPWQNDILKDQYTHAKEKEGESRPFEQWKTASGLPAYFRGYAFDQWPKEFNDKAYTSEQKTKLDGMMDYLRGGKDAPRNALSDISPAVNNMALSDNRNDSLTKFARDGQWVTSYDNNGLNLVYGDKFVRTGNGKPLFMSWEDLAARGKGGTAAANNIDLAGSRASRIRESATP